MLAAALLNYADDEGFFNANPKLVQAECCPLRDPSVSVHVSLAQLSDIGFIQVAQGEDGKTYGHIVKFLDHQRINRRTPSKIKDLVLVWEPDVKSHTQITDQSHPEGKGREQGREKTDPIGSSVAIAPPDDSVFDLSIALQRPHAKTDDAIGKLLWGAVLGYYGRATGNKSDTLRSWLGKLARDHGNTAVVAAAADCERMSPVDPKAWTERFLNGKRTDDSLTAFADAAGALAAGG